MRFPILRWLFSHPAAMFYCLAAYFWCGGGEVHGAAVAATILGQYIFAGSVALWVVGDAQRRQRSIPYDFGTFAFVAGPIFVPVYLFATRGWRAFATLGVFLLLYLAAWAFGSLLFFLQTHR